MVVVYKGWLDVRNLLEIIFCFLNLHTNLQWKLNLVVQKYFKKWISCSPPFCYIGGIVKNLFLFFKFCQTLTWKLQIEVTIYLKHFTECLLVNSFSKFWLFCNKLFQYEWQVKTMPFIQLQLLAGKLNSLKFEN